MKTKKCGHEVERRLECGKEKQLFDSSTAGGRRTCRWKKEKTSMEGKMKRRQKRGRKTDRGMCREDEEEEEEETEQRAKD